MSRASRIGSAAFVVLLVAGVLALQGCKSDAVETEEPTAETPVPSGNIATIAEGFDAMPADGAGESAAAAAVGGLLAEQKASGTWADADWEALETTAPVLVAYLVRVDMDSQVALFEVRADGRAHNIYGYHRAFDSGSIIWTPGDALQEASAAPASEGEKSAVGSVETAMRDAFPEDSFALAIHGYRFAYVVEGAQPFTIEVTPNGGLISAGM